jgi:hypothetical protein
MFLFDKLRALIQRFTGGDRDRIRLQRMCMGNLAAVERLIEFERTRSPGISEAEACRRAISRCARANR